MRSEDSVVEQILEPRPRDLGGVTVGRILPSVEHRFVGPFVFLDHLGPVTTAPGANIDSRPHPHIGLSTVTYLFEGEITHRDSLGSLQLLKPGDLNVMTAGRGVVHSERFDASKRARGIAVHAVQFWLGLPAVKEDGAPSFEHHPMTTLPEIRPSAGARGRVLCGSVTGVASPVIHPSHPTLIDVELDEGGAFDVPLDVEERGVYLVEGALRMGGRELERDRLALLRPGTAVRVEARTRSRLLVLGGPPIGHRFMDWNFVSSSMETIERARHDWKNQIFPKIPGDDIEFVPLPEGPRHART